MPASKSVFLDASGDPVGAASAGFTCNGCCIIDRKNMAQNFRNDLQRNVGTSEVTLITGGDFDAVIESDAATLLLLLF